MALVTPLLLVLISGGLEIGNYFMDEHRLVKAVRDGARFAGRKGFSFYQTCDATPTGTVSSDTQTVVRTSLLSGGSDQLPNWSGATFSVTTKCSTGSGGTTYSGIYSGMANGARYVRVSASVDYHPILAPFGINLASAKLDATQDAAVSGV